LTGWLSVLATLRFRNASTPDLPKGMVGATTGAEFGAESVHLGRQFITQEVNSQVSKKCLASQLSLCT
jgi:hypothetical protein